MRQGRGILSDGDQRQAVPGRGLSLDAEVYVNRQANNCGDPSLAVALDLSARSAKSAIQRRSTRELLAVRDVERLQF